jgi:hypothetical protein
MTGNGGKWTLESYIAHNEALRLADKEFLLERDRRYLEVALEREKAVRIKDDADKRALGLSRDAQTYKDTKANELREQINSERGAYALKTDITAISEKMDSALRPIMEYIAADRGRGIGALDNRATMAWVVAFVIALIAIGSFAFRAERSSPVTPQIIYVPAPSGTLLPQQRDGTPQQER